MSTPTATMLDLQPDLAQMRTEVLAGLRRPDKHLPPKYFYDAHGATLFERICEQPEYYPTRTEIAILETALPDIARALGPGCRVVEPGSGSGIKTEMLLAALDAPRAYLPIDIAREQLEEYAQRLREAHPDLAVLPICADFTADWSLPAGAGTPVLWFPGSTIGNFSRPAAEAFLRRLRQQSGADAELLIGVDLRKDSAVLEAAYNDAAGVTAEFNLNLLARLNRELGANFVLEHYRHQAIWDEACGAIRMLLISAREQTVQLAGESVHFEAGESICSEYSHKYAPEEFLALAQRAGWQALSRHFDPRAWFGIFHCRAAPA